MAEIVALLPFDLAQERELAIVAALFHDVAKIWTLDHQLHVTELGRLVSHDHLTLEACAPALADLESEWPDGALLLRHVWNSASPGARYGVDPRSPVAHAVRLADRFSAERCHAGLAFHDLSPSARHTTWRNRPFFRPSQP